MSKVSVTGLANQHFFNVKSCVVVDTGDPVREDIPMTIWYATLPKKNLTLTQCRDLLSVEETTYSFLDRSVSQSPYFAQAFQGATLNPHTLWFVEIDTDVSLNVSQPLVKTSNDAYSLCKEDKWKFRVGGRIEKDFLFVTALSDDILPFAIRGLTLAVLPVVNKGDRYAVEDHDDILAAGFPLASDWVERAERVFAGGTKDKKMTAQSRLNYQHLISIQNPSAPFIVLYNKSGTNISAAYLTSQDIHHFGELEVSGFVAESVTYRIYTETEDEALYLTGVLNSTVVNEAIKPYQTEGVYHGKRDIHRRPFEVCPIPLFDPEDMTHQKIVSLAKASREKLSHLASLLKGSLAKVREQARDFLNDEMAQIDGHVATLLSSRPVTAPQKNEPVPTPSLFDSL
jgi:hypothetical protein